MAFLTDTFSVQGTMGDKIAAVWARLVETRTKRKIFNQTVRELSSLSSRELADLGLNHSMIRRVAYQAAYQG
ncbi:DUF1127 domain-containing protein [Planktotalea arctica]|uniref:DUF1127 domain-containing protein n=1 Tax=Planktotalea arctica TaxID=1481893 RepID=UPI000A177637|nr:DUF1127 domain-containing protein [Planktotalea arctica]